MSKPIASLPLSRWTLDARTEPVIRVGVVLAEDAANVLNLTLEGITARVTDPAGGSASWEDGARLRVARHDEGLRVHSEGNPDVVVSAPIRIEPGHPTLGDAGVWVHGVTAGRGFHWQKRVDQRFAGSIEITPVNDGLVLINELSIEDYLTGVITAEMGADCPIEFLKAQCIVARSWLLAMTEPKHDTDPFDRCNDDCCQRYQGNGHLSKAARRGVNGSCGCVLLDPAGEVLDANYAKSCGGVSERPEFAWGVNKPGISAVVDAPTGAAEHRFFPVTRGNLDEFLDGNWIKDTRCFCGTNAVSRDVLGRYLGRVDEVDDYFRWTARYTRPQLEAQVVKWLPEAASLEELRDLRVTERGVSGRASRVELEWLDSKGGVTTVELDSEYHIRQVLHEKFLYSSAFAVRSKRDTAGRLESVILRGAGWGHGVGLCQIGALGMALQGYDAETICRHYYPEANLASAYG